MPDNQHPTKSPLVDSAGFLLGTELREAAFGL
jgi:hypothetical protein